MPDGFEINFTMPVDRKSAEDLASIAASSFIYKHHPAYGSPPVNKQDLKVKGVKLSEDGKTLRVVLDGLRPFYVHELNLEGIRSAVNSWSLVHPTVYYTLNAIPAGNKLATNEVKTFDSGKVKAAAPSKTAKELVSPDGKGKTTAVSATTAPVTFATIKPLLQKHTCLACHAEDKRLVGPAFKEIAKRKYSNEKIVQLIYNPKPENWPDYATPMAAMPQVPKKDALTIAAYINSLR
jgi:cytochrome c551/c552